MSVPVDAVHEIPVDALARDARRVSTGFVVAALVAMTLSAGLAATVFAAPWPDLYAPTALWFWLFAAVAFALLLLAARFRQAYTAAHLWLVAITLPLLVALVAACLYLLLPDNRRLALRAMSKEEIVALGMVGAAVLQLLAWLLVYPPLASVRLLRSHAGAGGVGFVGTMRDAAAATSPLYGPAGQRRTQVLEIAAMLLALAAFLVVNWLAWHRADMLLFMIGTILALMVVVAGYPIWRRLRTARATVGSLRQQDTRPPVLLLEAIEDEIAARRSLPWSPLRGTRLERLLERELGRRGPFAAIGVPDGPMPDLPSTRPDDGHDSRPSAFDQWSGTAQLILAVASGRMWARWELDRLIERRHLDKLVILMPAVSAEDARSRWENLAAKLKPTPWGEALGSIAAERLIALRLRPGGRITAVTGAGRGSLHYLLAIRLLTA